MMDAQAHIIAWLNLETLKVEGAGIYSEKRTTAKHGLKPVCLYTFPGTSFADALDNARRWASSSVGRSVLGEPLCALLEGS